jgi:hypothetical protein
MSSDIIYVYSPMNCSIFLKCKPGLFRMHTVKTSWLVITVHFFFLLQTFHFSPNIVSHETPILHEVKNKFLISPCNLHLYLYCYSVCKNESCLMVVLTNSYKINKLIMEWTVIVSEEQGNW